MEFNNKYVCVVGTGVSGVAATELLITKGANVIWFDNKKKEETELLESLNNIEHMDASKITFYFEEFPFGILPKIDLFVMSPGVPLEQTYLEASKEYNIPIWGEVELAYQCSKGKVIAITGTNGKTTTTSLVGEIMKSFYKEVFVVGNIGIPYTSVALHTSEDSIIIAETSSYQIETIHTFKPVVSAVLNITPDHLMRHKTIEQYARVKELVSRNQTPDSIVVYNYDDKYTREMASRSKCKVLFFSRKEKLEDGIFLDGDSIVVANDTINTKVCQISELKIFGSHNIENVMAAIGLSISVGVPLEKIREVVTSFTGVEHRIEYVTEINGVKYYNDSKATNPDSAMKGLLAMSQPTILIGGGQDKKLPNGYDEWVTLFSEQVKHLVLFGETKHDIEEAAKKVGFTNITIVNTLKEAVLESYRLAEFDDVVLLSPACASWDMFQSFEERGNLFKKYVRELE